MGLTLTLVVRCNDQGYLNIFLDMWGAGWGAGSKCPTF